MKLIIDIKEETYRRAIQGQTVSMRRAIVNGTLLEDIKNEIERKANSGQWCDAYGAGLIKAIYIIDKHIEERSSE